VVGKLAGGFITIAGPEFAAGPVAIGVHRGLGHAQLAGDLFGAEVTINQPQTLTLSLS
jgi:hypothetical protein